MFKRLFELELVSTIRVAGEQAVRACVCPLSALCCTLSSNSVRITEKVLRTTHILRIRAKEKAPQWVLNILPRWSMTA